MKLLREKKVKKLYNKINKFYENIKTQKRERRHKKIRSTISGTAARPRISVFKSNAELFVQVIDDKSEKTLMSISTKQKWKY